MKRIATLWVGLLFGCQGISYDLDGAPLQPTGGDTPDMFTAGDMAMADMAAFPDGSVPADMSPTDMNQDGGANDGGSDMADAPDMVTSKCEIPQPLDSDRCNPTETGVCPGNGFCTLAVAATPPPELLCVMRDLEGAGDVGTACTRVSDCREGTTCVDWGLQDADPRPKACARFCEIETGAGCSAGEFCTSVTSQPPTDGIGYCTPTCDPYDADACPSGQTCNVDFNYPVSTCEPHFRCVEAEGFGAEGESCGPGRRIASCAEDLVCNEVDVANFRCVSPCQDDADCGGEACQPAQGSFMLRFCTLP